MSSKDFPERLFSVFAEAESPSPSAVTSQTAPGSTIKPGERFNQYARNFHYKHAVNLEYVSGGRRNDVDKVACWTQMCYHDNDYVVPVSRLLPASLPCSATGS